MDGASDLLVEDLWCDGLSIFWGSCYNWLGNDSIAFPHISNLLVLEIIQDGDEHLRVFSVFHPHTETLLVRLPLCLVPPLLLVQPVADVLRLQFESVHITRDHSGRLGIYEAIEAWLWFLWQLLCLR